MDVAHHHALLDVHGAQLRALNASLRAKDWAALDAANLAEEIESLGRSDRRAIVSHLERLLLHLLLLLLPPVEEELLPPEPPWSGSRSTGAPSPQAPRRCAA